VIAYAPDSGSELWRVRGTSDIPCPSIIVGDELLFSTSGGNGPVMAIRPGGSGDVTATHVVWRHAVGGPYVPTGVYVEGRLFTIADSGLFRCLEAESGRELWRRRLRGAFTASLVAGAGCIYAASERGEVYVLAADDHYELLAVNSLNEGCFATPAVAEGEILLRTARRLYCIARRPQQLAAGDDPGANSGDGESEARHANSAEIPVLHNDPASPSDLPVDVTPSEVTPSEVTPHGGSPVKEAAARTSKAEARQAEDQQPSPGPPSDAQSAAPAAPPRLWRKLLERRRQR
jgi:outer membrane protein assembly factor BamB